MPAFQRSPELADAYAEGMTHGLELAATYSEEHTCPVPFTATRAFRRLVITVLIVSAVGWLYGGLELAGVVPVPFAPGHAPSACTFDGGGTIASGDAARVSTGQEYVCTDGTLVRITGYGS
jgi:hypothetical protein